MGVADCYAATSQSPRPDSSASRGGDAATCCSSDPDDASIYSELPQSDSFSGGGGESGSRCSGGGGGEGGSRCCGGGSRFSGSGVDGDSRLNFGPSSGTTSLRPQHQNLQDQQKQQQQRAAPRQSKQQSCASPNNECTSNSSSSSAAYTAASTHASARLTSSQSGPLITSGSMMTSAPMMTSTPSSAAPKTRLVSPSLPSLSNSQLVTSSQKDLGEETSALGLTEMLRESQQSNVEMRKGKQDGKSSQ